MTGGFAATHNTSTIAWHGDARLAAAQAWRAECFRSDNAVYLGMFTSAREPGAQVTQAYVPSRHSAGASQRRSGPMRSRRRATRG